MALGRATTYMVVPSQGNGNRGLGATCAFGEMGVQIPIDSANKLRFSFRYGYERKRFEKEPTKEIYFFYHLRNHSFSLCSEVVTPLFKNLSFTAGINLAYIVASHEGGGGQRSSGYTYSIAVEEDRNIIDVRPHLGLELPFSKKKNTTIFIEGAMSLISRSAKLKDQLISANFPEKFYSINYSTLFFSAGLRF